VCRCARCSIQAVLRFESHGRGTSNYPRIEPASTGKLRDMVGPAHSLVRSLGEKSQMYTPHQTGLPITKGRARTMARDHIPHGMNTMLAALNVLAETAIGVCQPLSLFLREDYGVTWLASLGVHHDTPHGPMDPRRRS